MFKMLQRSYIFQRTNSISHWIKLNSASPTIRIKIRTSTSCSSLLKWSGVSKIDKINLHNLVDDAIRFNKSTTLHISRNIYSVSKCTKCSTVNNQFCSNIFNSSIPWKNRLRNYNQIRLKSTEVLTDARNGPTLPEEAVKNRDAGENLLYNKPKEILYTDNEETRQILKLYPAPKNVLHNIYDVLSRETDKKSLKLSPQYKSVKNGNKSVWLCAYHVRWPEDIKFLARDSKKSLASHKAALIALTWLKSDKKITQEGLPLMYEKDEVKKLARKSFPTFIVDKNTLEKMKEIDEIYQNEVAPHIIKNIKNLDQDSVLSDDESSVVQEPGNINLQNIRRQRYIGLPRYLAKEKVDLPIAAYKNNFVDLLRQNQVIIVKGEPGCGKSTRIPQYVLETWAKEDGLLGEPGRIAVTQPRRIAAISLAERVSSERDEAVGHIVGYQVRLKSEFKPASGRILYCTTGILLRRLQNDSLLSTFTHVILDEAHERDVNTDLLMNLLRNAINSNPRLKLIVMSATIDTSLFSKFFNGAPILEIPGFTYPVEQHFLDTFPEINVSKTLKMCDSENPSVIHEDVVRVIKYIHENKKEGAILCFLPGWEDISKICKMIPERGDLIVYCLHSRLHHSEQWKIFSRPPPGVRKIILATNIAETSVTIDDVVYVVDTGIHKEQRLDVDKGVNCIDNHWISKSSVNQRKGRAGRVQPGESFHLYPRSKYESLPEFSLPEILRTSLTKIVLDSKVFSNNMNALEFMQKLPTPPEENATLKAVEELKDLELLDDEENLTSLGRTVANFQLEPKLSKAMVNAVIFKCVTPIVDIVTLYSAETELFTSGLINKEEIKNVKMYFCTNSDHLAMMRVFEKWLELVEERNSYEVEKFTQNANLVPHKMNMIEKLRKIHFDYLYNGLYDVLPISDTFSDNNEMVKAILFSGVGTVLQHRTWDIVKNRLKNNVNVFLTRNNHRATITSESVNFKRKKYPNTNLLLYINEVRSNIRRTTLVRECSLISKLSVLLFSNKNLKIKEVEKEYFSSDIKTQDQVKIFIENTNIEFVCDRAQAQDLIKCKDALMSCYQYYIQQLTHTGDSKSEVNASWDSILDLVGDILNRNGV